MRLLYVLLTIAYFALIAWIVLSWVVAFGRLTYGHPVRRVFDALAAAINPVLEPIRRVIPPLRVGGMALDLAPLVLFFAIAILRGMVA